MNCSVEVYADEDGNVGLLIHNAAIIEYDNDELVPGASFSPAQAREVAAALITKATELESE